MVLENLFVLYSSLEIVLPMLIFHGFYTCSYSMIFTHVYSDLTLSGSGYYSFQRFNFSK